MDEVRTGGRFTPRACTDYEKHPAVHPSGNAVRRVCTPVEHCKETGVGRLRTIAAAPGDSVSGRPAGAQGVRAVVGKRPRAVATPGDTVPRWLRISGTYYSISRGAT